MLELTAGPRLIRDGKDFDSFFPMRLSMTDPIVKRDGSVEDSVKFMAKVAEQFKADTALLAPYLKGQNLHETCANIWDFIYSFIQYHEDADEVEQIRRPARTWADRKNGVDCDCMSVFASSILRNLGIKHVFRITRYEKPEFQHVYVIVPIEGSIDGTNGYYTIDGVINGFNKEKSFTEKKDFDIMKGMPIQLLNGLGESRQSDDWLKAYLTLLLEKFQSCPQVIQGISACDARELLYYVIKNWDDIYNRAAALQRTAEIEKKLFPDVKFWQTIWAYEEGMAGISDLIHTSYFTPQLLGLGEGGEWWSGWGSGAAGAFNDLMQTIAAWDVQNKQSKYNYQTQSEAQQSQQNQQIPTYNPPPQQATIIKPNSMSAGTITTIAILGIIAAGAVIYIVSKDKSKPSVQGKK